MPDARYVVRLGAVEPAVEAVESVLVAPDTRVLKESVQVRVAVVTTAAGALLEGRVSRTGYFSYPRYAARRYSWCRPPSTGISTTTPAPIGDAGGRLGTC
jgi:hypothetical protein